MADAFQSGIDSLASFDFGETLPSLDSLFHAAEDITFSGLESYNAYEGLVSETYAGLNEMIGDVRRRFPRLASEIKNQQSVVQEQANQALEKGLKNQAALAASFGGFNAASTQSQLLKQASETQQGIAGETLPARIQEEYAKHKLRLDIMTAQNQLIGSALETKTNLVSNASGTAAGLAQAGLQATLGATTIDANLKNAELNRQSAEKINAERNRVSLEIARMQADEAKKRRQQEMLMAVVNAASAVVTGGLTVSTPAQPGGGQGITQPNYGGSFSYGGYGGGSGGRVL